MDCRFLQFLMGKIAYLLSYLKTRTAFTRVYAKTHFYLPPPANLPTVGQKAGGGKSAGVLPPADFSCFSHKRAEGKFTSRFVTSRFLG